MNFRLMGALLIVAGYVTWAVAGYQAIEAQADIAELENEHYIAKGNGTDGPTMTDFREVRDEMDRARWMSYVGIGVGILGLIICIAAKLSRSRTLAAGRSRSPEATPDLARELDEYPPRTAPIDACGDHDCSS